jgi:pyruvate dehydrogenase E2 component (dihydrolipoamide acetyltransferase)
MTLETDKATMDIPATHAGEIVAWFVKVGQKISEGDVIGQVKVLDAENLVSKPAVATASVPTALVETPVLVALDSAVPAQSARFEVAVPDIGGHANVDLIEIHIKVGDEVALDTPLMTLETDKATMDIPSPAAGKVTELLVKVGQKVTQGDLIVVLETQASFATTASQPVANLASSVTTPVAVVSTVSTPTSMPSSHADEVRIAANAELAYAGPVVRKLARELGVDLSLVKGSGHKQRITEDDVKGFVKQVMQAPQTSHAATQGVGLDLLPWPKVDFSKFGATTRVPRSKIQRSSAANLHRNWVMIPHVTFNDQADITDLEAFRVTLNKEWEKEGIKLSPLAFMIKAAAEALKAFPAFNSSLDGDELVLKQYCHIGFAADTPNGLVVPVIKDVDKKGLKAITQELASLSALAREGKLKPTDMQGASFTISSLGGIGGTSFTPIINAPEVAILGVCKSTMQPVWQGHSFEPRLMCPLSLSFDHRVIDGAAAAKFTVYIAKLLADVRRLIL